MKTRAVATSCTLVAALFGPMVYHRTFGTPDPDGAMTVAILASAWLLLTIGCGFVVAEVVMSWDAAISPTEQSTALAMALVKLALCLALVVLTRAFLTSYPMLILFDLVLLFVLARWRTTR